jgi:hypothetical protein
MIELRLNNDMKRPTSLGIRVLVALICLLVGGISASAGSVDPAVVRAALRRHTRSVSSGASHTSTSGRHSDAIAIRPNSSATPSPLLPFSMQGSGTQGTTTDGTCSGGTCAASSGDCQCLKYQGTLNASTLGAANWTASVTVNVDDCTLTGTPNGFCCVADGILGATDTTSSANILSMSFTGPLCVDPNAALDVGVSGTFIILSSSSSGTFAQSTGTGQLNLFSTASSDGTAYVAGDGLLQVISPL